MNKKAVMVMVLCMVLASICYANGTDFTAREKELNDLVVQIDEEIVRLTTLRHQAIGAFNEVQRFKEVAKRNEELEKLEEPAPAEGEEILN